MHIHRRTICFCLRIYTLSFKKLAKQIINTRTLYKYNGIYVIYLCYMLRLYILYALLLLMQIKTYFCATLQDVFARASCVNEKHAYRQFNKEIIVFLLIIFPFVKVYELISGGTFMWVGLWWDDLWWEFAKVS